MSMRHIFTFTVAIRSPFSFGDVDATGIGIDTPALRDKAGLAILPANHLKGLLREGFRALEEKAPAKLNGFSIGDLFGPAHGNGDPWATRRASLLFADLKQTGQVHRGKQTRVKIDHDSGTVETGMLMVVDLAAPLGVVEIFVGQLIWHGTGADAEKLRETLQLALRIIPYFGGMRSSGFGQHMREQSSVSVAAAPNLNKAGAFSVRIRMRANFDRPFTVNVKNLAANVYKGGEVVPGSAIKGAIADMLAAGGRTVTTIENAVLSALRISHGYPIDENGQRKARALPLSIAVLESAKTFHCTLGGGVDAINTGADLPIYIGDMKYAQQAELAQKIDRPAADLPEYALAHTAINPANGSAETEKFYVLIARGNENSRFEFELDFSTASQPAAINYILSVLVNGLDSVGKTNARLLGVTLDNAPPLPVVKPTGPWRVMLETPAQFFAGPLKSCASTADLLTQYFRYVLPGATIVDYRVARSIVGGWPIKRSGAGRYEPISLYSEGCCFLLDGDAAVAKRLAELRATGLPLLEQTSAGVLQHVNDYKKSLYLPANGYGEISIDDASFAGVMS